MGDPQPPAPRPMLTWKNPHLQKEWENAPSFFVKKKKPWNNIEAKKKKKKVKGVKDRGEGTKEENRKEEGEFEKYI